MRQFKLAAVVAALSAVLTFGTFMVAAAVSQATTNPVYMAQWKVATFRDADAACNSHSYAHVAGPRGNVRIRLYHCEVQVPECYWPGTPYGADYGKCAVAAIATPTSASARHYTCIFEGSYRGRVRVSGMRDPMCIEGVTPSPAKRSAMVARVAPKLTKQQAESKAYAMTIHECGDRTQVQVPGTEQGGIYVHAFNCRIPTKPVNCGWRVPFAVNVMQCGMKFDLIHRDRFNIFPDKTCVGSTELVYSGVVITARKTRWDCYVR